MREVQLRAIIAITIISSASLLNACGGGGSTPSATPTASPPMTTAPTTPSIPSMPTTPKISWLNDQQLTASAQSRTVGLSTDAAITVTGTQQVDFFVDGTLIGTTTSGGKMPGVWEAWYFSSWDTGNFPDGPHVLTARVTDKSGATADTAPIIVNVQNNITLPVSLSVNQIFPIPSSNSAGTGQIALNLATGAIAGDLSMSGISATAVHIHSGFATSSGSVALSLAFDNTSMRWIIPQNGKLTTTAGTSQVDTLLAGGMYVDAHSTNYPDGEIRAQLLPSNLNLAFSYLSGGQEIPPNGSQGKGVVGMTLNRTTGRYRLNARTVGVQNVVSIGVYNSPGPATMSTWRFFLRADADGNLVAEDLGPPSSPYTSTSSWYVNVTTAAYVSGEIGGPAPVIPPTQ